MLIQLHISVLFTIQHLMLMHTHVSVKDQETSFSMKWLVQAMNYALLIVLLVAPMTALMLKMLV